MARKRKKKRNRQPAKSQPSMNLSICMIVRDEQETLPGCLKSIHGLADELIVVDTGSADRTVEIAKEQGAQVSHFEWIDDFSAARNASLKEATGDWILWVDADDRIDRKHHKVIRQLMCQPEDRAFAFVLENVGSDEATCVQVRMFPNLPGVQFSMPVHEQVTPCLMKLGITKIAQVDVVVTHTGYTDAETIQKKKHRYLQIMQQWLEQHPDDYVTRSHVALTYHTTGRPEDAIREYGAVISNPRCQAENVYLHRYALLFLGRSQMQCGSYHAAISTFEQAQEAGIEPTLLHLSLGECHHRLGQAEKAVEHLGYVRDHPMQRTYFPIDIKTIHYAALHFLGLNLEKLERTDEAAKEYQRAAQFTPENPEAWLSLAKLHQKQNAWELAQEALQKAIRHGIQHADIHHLSGLSALHQEQLAEARYHFQHALQLQPHHQSAGNNLGLTLRLIGEPQAAKSTYQSVLEFHPQSTDTLINLAHLHLSSGEFEEAQRRFWQVLTAEGASLDVLLGFAWASATLGQQDQVLLAQQEICHDLGRFNLTYQSTQAPSGAPGELAGIFVQMAGELWDQQRRELALYAAQTALALAPSPETWEFLGDLHGLSQSPQQALDCYEQALLTGSARAKDIFHKLGQCYTLLGVTEAAKLCQEQAA